MARVLRIFLACVALLAWAGVAQAQTLDLANLVLDNQAGNVMVRFSLTLGDLAELDALLKEGTRLKLACEAELSRRRNFLFDSTISEAHLESVLQYEPLAKEYLLTMPGREQPLRHTDLAALLADTWGRLSLDLGPFDAIEQSTDHRLDVTVSLKNNDVPSWLRQALFFWSWEVAPTARYRMDFQF